MSKPTAAQIKEAIAAATVLPQTSPRFLELAVDTPKQYSGLGYMRDFSRTHIGTGEGAFANARSAFERWVQFDLGWIRVANPSAPIRTGQIVAIEARTLGLWSLNLSRIVETVDKPTQFGFVYATTAMHVEQGEEQFLLEFDTETGLVTYTLEAVLRPRNALARLGYPFTRAMQHRFVRDSHVRMGNEVVPAAQ